MAVSCLHTVSKGSSNLSAVLQLPQLQLTGCTAGWHLPRFKWHDQGRGDVGMQGHNCSDAAQSAQWGNGKEEKLSAPSAKKSEMGLDPSHWIKSTISMPELFLMLYTRLTVGRKNYKFYASYKSSTISHHHGRAAMKWKSLFCCSSALIPHAEASQGTGMAAGKAMLPEEQLLVYKTCTKCIYQAANAEHQPCRHTAANASGTRWHCATSLLSFAMRLVR